MYSSRGPRIKKHCSKGLNAPNTSVLEHGKCRNVKNCGGGSCTLTHGISKSYVLEWLRKNTNILPLYRKQITTVKCCCYINLFWHRTAATTACKHTTGWHAVQHPPIWLFCTSASFKLTVLMSSHLVDTESSKRFPRHNSVSISHHSRPTCMHGGQTVCQTLQAGRHSAVWPAAQHVTGRTVGCGRYCRLRITWSYLNIQPVPRSKHSVAVIQTSQLMLYREIIAVCSEIHKKTHKCTVWAESRIAEC